MENETVKKKIKFLSVATLFAISAVAHLYFRFHAPVEFGRVAWREISPNTTELSMDGVELAKGCIELCEDGICLIGYCIDNSSLKRNLFVIDVSKDPGNCIKWFEPGFSGEYDYWRAKMYDKGMFLKLRTYYDYKSGRIRPGERDFL